MVIREDVLKLSFPIIAEQTFIVLMGMVNIMMAGHIGEEAVSAIGLVDSINNIFIFFFSALAVGGTVVVAHYTGQKNNKSANDAAKQALLAGLTLSLVTTIIIWTFRYPIIEFLYGSAEKNVLDNAIVYLAITLTTYPLIALTSIASGVLRGAGDTRTPMKITIIMNIINVIFSYILIYGIRVENMHFYIQLPALEVKGAAIGIAIARASGAVLILYTLFKGSQIIKLSGVYPIKLDMNMQKSIFGIGIPASIESLLFHGGKLITQVFIVGMGTTAIAANYIAGSVSTMINIPGSALSIAATTIVGQSMGKGESEQAKKDLIYVIKLSSVCLLLLCALVFPFAEWISLLYTQNDQIKVLSASLIRISAVCIPIFWPFAFILNAGLKGAGDAKYTMVTSVIGMWAFRVTLGYILGIPLKMGVIGVWMGMFADWLVRGILYYFRLKNEKWKKNSVVKSADAAP